jgi:hypothetical protein
MAPSLGHAAPFEHGPGSSPTNKSSKGLGLKPSSGTVLGGRQGLPVQRFVADGEMLEHVCPFLHARVLYLLFR